MSTRPGLFRPSNRGTSTVIGFVLIFALIITTLTIYQSDVVPHQNEQIEHQHAEQIVDQFASLQSATREVSSKGTPTSVVIEGSPDYPTRVFGINGPEPQSHLTTTEPHQVSLAGFATPEERYWDGSEREFETRLLEFRTEYNFANRNERLYLEHGVGVRHVDDGAYTTTESGLLNGDQLDLVLLDGVVDTQQRTHEIRLSPVSTSTEYHTVNATEVGGDAPSIRVPTVRTTTDWEAAVADDDRITSVTVDRGPDDRIGHAELVFEPGTELQLRITKLTLGDAWTPSPEYITTSEAVQTGLTTERSHELEVTARDRYGNPVAADVSLSADGSGVVHPGSTVHASEGTTSFVYEPKSGATANVQAGVGQQNRPYQRVRFRFDDYGGMNVLDIHNDGQLFGGIGDVGSIRVSDVYAEAVSDPPCLLGDIDSGLLGLLSSITCLDDSADVTSIKAQITAEDSDVTYDLYFELVDADQNDWLLDGSDYASDHYVAVRIDSASKSEVGDDVVFTGTLDPLSMNHIYVEKDGHIDLLDESSYIETEWERECIESGLLWLGCQEYDHGVDNFDDLFDEPVDTVYIEETRGRATFEVE